MPTTPHPTATGVTGRLLTGLVSGTGRIRPATKPLHPRGDVEVVVRRSRGAGLPALWPDVNGLTVRVPTRDVGAAGDLLLDDEPAVDMTVSFDPVLHLPDGLTSYDAVVRLREPAHAMARRRRSR